MKVGRLAAALVVLVLTVACSRSGPSSPDRSEPLVTSVPASPTIAPDGQAQLKVLAANLPRDLFLAANEAFDAQYYPATENIMVRLYDPGRLSDVQLNLAIFLINHGVTNLVDIQPDWCHADSSNLPPELIFSSLKWQCAQAPFPAALISRAQSEAPAQARAEAAKYAPIAAAPQLEQLISGKAPTSRLFYNDEWSLTYNRFDTSFIVMIYDENCAKIKEAVRIFFAAWGVKDLSKLSVIYLSATGTC